ncbi:hypothetical protein EMCRGX_G015229 [Ephydatia muelleri]
MRVYRCEDPTYPPDLLLNTIIYWLSPSKSAPPPGIEHILCRIGREGAVRCNGTETSLSQWSHSETTTGCTHASDAAVVCRQSVSDGDVRLVGSPTNGQGAVEIYDQASLKWYRVCPTGWTSSYASVVCQRLGYNREAAAEHAHIAMGQVALDSSTMSALQLNYVSQPYWMLHRSIGLTANILECWHLHNSAK